ncbi:hypothetical protein Tco_0271494 [Tanacetum coccineum]
MMVQAQQEQGEGSDMPIDPHHTPTIIPPSTSQPQRKQRPRKPKRKDTEIPQSSVPVENELDEAVYEERDDSLERATTTATDLDTEQDRGNISKTQSKATPNEPSSIGTSSGGGPRRQDTLGDRPSQTSTGDYKSEKESQERNKKSGTHGLKRLYKVGLSARIDSLDVEASLGDQEDASKQGRKIHDIGADEDITLENVHDADMFRVHDLDGDEVFVETEEHMVNTATTTSTIPVSAAKDLSNVDMTLAQALAELKSAKPKPITTTSTTTTTTVTRPKAKEIVIQEQEQASTPITSSKDKGKGIMDDRIAREKEEANAALIAQWNDIQDKVETDYELAQRLQAEEQEELTIKEKSKLFQQLLEKRRNFLAAKRAEEKRNKPLTKAQQRKLVGGSEVREEGIEKRKESSSKRASDELEQEPSKKQKMEDDKEITELQSMMEVIPDEEEVVVDAIPLATKPPSIVDWKIIKEGKIGYYQIIRADGNSKRYSSMIQMLKSFDMDDLETIWKLVKAKHGYTRPEEGYERVLWGDLKTMFEHNIEDIVWRNLLGNKVLIWKLFNSRGVHFVRFQDMHIFMLVEK